MTTQIINAVQVASMPGRSGVTYTLDVPPHTAYVWDGTAMRPISAMTAAQVAANLVLLSGAGTYVNTSGALYALAETTPYVTPAQSVGSLSFTGACELAGWFCSVAAGTITIYDALSAVGTPIVPATTLVVGPMPIFGAGTTGKLVMTTGCFVVLSGAATVRVLVG